MEYIYLVHLGCYDKNAIDGWLKQQTVLEAGKFVIKVPPSLNILFKINLLPQSLNLFVCLPVSTKIEALQRQGFWFFNLLPQHPR